jgi:2-oxo-3-hexenedioate decarboxylase
MEDRAIADEILASLRTGSQIAPLTARDSGFRIADGYRIARIIRDLRGARGESPVGRKIGFTNRDAWPMFKADAPMWGYVYASTTHDLLKASRGSLAGVAEPRIEPEIVFGLASTPAADMDDDALAGCLAWVAHGFEIVQSIYPRWNCLAADAVSAFGMHDSLWIGPRHSVAARAGAWARELTACEVELFRNGASVDRGHAANVLGSPLKALRAIISILALDPHNPPLAAGEVITTGSLTRAAPIFAGEVWTTRMTGIPLEDARLDLIDG